MPTLERLDSRSLREVMTTFRNTVREHAPGLNRLNVYPVPDGDTGTNMSLTLRSVVAEIDGAGVGPADRWNAISHG
ncbi:MAG: DAK2 domain-containing protein, partial [Ilumatobacteraceae bacterium]